MMSRTDYTRRRFLARVGTAGVGLMALPLFGCQSVLASYERPPLVADPDGILDLLPGFSYSILTRTGDRMDDGLLVPAAPDGMGAFAGKNGRVVLVRNHELHSGHAELSALAGGGKIERAAFYDSGQGSTPGHGGTTTLIYNPRSGQVESQHMSLAA